LQTTCKINKRHLSTDTVKTMLWSACIMIEFKPRLWTMMGLSAIAIVGLSACQPGGEGGAGAGAGEGEAGNVVSAPSAPAVGAPATSAQAGGEAGEAGAQNAYAGVAEASRLGLRIAHVTGFLLIAQKTYEAGQNSEASVLVSQGLLEVYRPAEGELDAGAAGLKAAFEKVVAALDANKPKAEIDAAFADALKIAREREAASGAIPQDVIGGMLSIGAGLYSLVIAPEGNDPIEYQHAQGAILAAKASFDANTSKLTGLDAARTATLATDLDAIVALFPAVSIPETPASVASLTGAVSRAQLALSGIK
jgi:hypothetical protein